ncbi:MAG: LysM repeat protein [Cellvibrionaceae bacterium]|jgi:LysM repeat protein
MLPFILINIVVSAVVMAGMLYWWDLRNGQQNNGSLAAVQVPITGSEPGLIELAPTLPPTETPVPPTATPTPAPTYHQVQPGESLGSISDIYGVSMQDIMNANGILNENFIQAGQDLLIPEDGIVIVEPTAEAVTATPIGDPPTPIPTESLGTGEAELTVSSVNGVGDLAVENILIVNNGTRSIEITGWEVRDSSGTVYKFGQGATLFGGGAGISLFSTVGEDTPTRRYWNLSAPVWQSGEIVQIFDAEGTLQVTTTVP